MKILDRKPMFVNYMHLKIFSMFSKNVGCYSNGYLFGTFEMFNCIISLNNENQETLTIKKI
jgi:hypothetical protein